MRKKELVALLLLSFGCIFTVNVLWLLLTGWVGLQCAIVVFLDHIHVLFGLFCIYCLFWCHMAVNILCLFLALPWVGLQCVNVAFSGQSLFLLCIYGNGGQRMHQWTSHIRNLTRAFAAYIHKAWKNTWWVSFDIKFIRQGFENACWHREACRAIQHAFSKAEPGKLDIKRH